MTRAVAILLLLAVGLASSAAAGTARTIRGTVTRAGNGEPVADASVFGERGEAAVTDADGSFVIVLTTTAARELTVVASGFETRTVRIVRGVNVVELQPAKGGEVIEVSGTAPEETKPVSYSLTLDEIRSIPGAGNDVLRAATVLPGVARIPYSFGGLVLRGMSPRDTAVYLDGIEVPIAFHFGGITSFYPGGMLDELEVNAGGFDASYGRASGGIVSLTTREPRVDLWRIGGSVGLFDSSVHAEGPFRGGGMIVGLRRSYLDAVARPFVEAETPLPSYYDFQLRTTFGDARGRGRIAPMIFASLDRVASNDTAVNSSFVRLAMPYRRQRGATTLDVVPWVGVNLLSFSSDPEDEPAQSFLRPVYPAGVRAQIVEDHAWGHLAAGTELESGYLGTTEVNGDELDGASTLAWTDFAVWTEVRWKTDGDRFAVKPGLRAEAYGLTDEIVIDPRLNLHQRLWAGVTLRQAIGRFHQPPIPAEVDPVAGNPELNSSYTDQVSLGIDTELPQHVLASVTGYFHQGSKLGVAVDDDEAGLGGLGPTFQLLLEKQLGFPSVRQNVGRARSYGVEILLKRDVGRLFTMLSYTLAKSERTDDPRARIGWRPFELDQRHNLQVAASIGLKKWRLGARVQLVSGNPYTPIGGEPFGAHLPAFFSLDLRADRRWRTRRGDLVFYLDVQNATYHRNVEGREIGERDGQPVEEDIPGLPIIPFIGLELRPR